MTKTHWQNITLVVLSTIFALICGEVAFRIKSYLGDRSTLENFENLVTRPAQGADVKFGDMIMLSKNKNIMYEFQRNLSVRFVDAEVNINANGFRGKVINRNKGPEVVRIVGIGDSQMFGWGVRDEEVYLTRLQDRLSSQFPECIWEAVNTAVPGYNTVMEVETLKEKGLAYEPDYVILGFIGNDLNLPHFTSQQEDYLSLNKSFLISYFTKSIQSVGLKWEEPERWRPTFDQQITELVPERHKHMVGEASFLTAMHELRDLSLTHGFEVIVIISNDNREFTELNRLVRDTSADMGFGFLELFPLWEKYAAENLIANPDKARYLSETDPHASALAHDAMSLGLFDAISVSAPHCVR